MKKQIDILIKRLEKNGFCVQTCLYAHGQMGYDAATSTPAGEDWHITFDDNVDFLELANSFDVDDEVGLWIEAKRNGTAGVPGVSVLLTDAKWKKRTLNRIAKGL